MRISSFKLPALLELLSYQIVVTAIGFALAARFLQPQVSDVAAALDATASILGLLALLMYRLSNHEE